MQDLPVSGKRRRPEIEGARDGIVAVLQGRACDLSLIVLDMERVTPFHRRVYAMARGIPRGETRTYGDVAIRMGVPALPVPSGKRSDETRLRSSCRAIGWSLPVARSAAFPPMAAL